MQFAWSSAETKYFTTTDDIIITAYCGEESAICLVKVTTVVSISSISLSQTTATITNRESFEIEAIVNDEATEIVKWSVDDENADKVSLSSQTGDKITVTGLKVGEGIELTAKGEFQNKTAKCMITVEPILSYYGTRVKTGVTSVNGQAIDDNWKIFYADVSIAVI